MPRTAPVRIQHGIILNRVSDVTAWFAEALFVSNLLLATEPTAEQVVAAVRDTFRRHSAEPEIIREQVAAEYGAWPEEAPARMRRCLEAVTSAFSPELRSRTYLTGRRQGGAR